MLVAYDAQSWPEKFMKRGGNLFARILDALEAVEYRRHLRRFLDMNDDCNTESLKGFG